MDDKNKLTVEQVQSGLYVVKAEYDGKYDYFAPFMQTEGGEKSPSAKEAGVSEDS